MTNSMKKDRDPNQPRILVPGALNQETADRAYDELIKFWGREPTWEEFKNISSLPNPDVIINKTIASTVTGTKFVSIGNTIFFGFILTVTGFLALPISILLYFLGYLTSWWQIIIGLALAIFLIKVARAGQCSGILKRAREDKEVYEILMRSGAFIFRPGN